MNFAQPFSMRRDEENIVYKGWKVYSVDLQLKPRWRLKWRAKPHPNIFFGSKNVFYLVNQNLSTTDDFTKQNGVPSSVFFLREKVYGRESHFLPILGFFCRANLAFHPYLFSNFLLFSRRYFFYRDFLGFFHGREKRVSRSKFPNSTGIVTSLKGIFRYFSTCVIFFFTCVIYQKYLRAKNDFHTHSRKIF